MANFAYDPINYEHFRQLNILDMFLDVVAEETDEKMIEYGMGGICNCCLDPLNMSYLLENDGVNLTVKCLSSGSEETVLSAITTLFYMTTPETKKGLSLSPSPLRCNFQLLFFYYVATTADNIVGLMKKFAESSNKRLSNLANIFLQDCCKLSVGVAAVGGASLDTVIPYVSKENTVRNKVTS